MHCFQEKSVILKTAIQSCSFFTSFFNIQEIGNLKKLRYFDITENTVDWIADEIGECHSMTDLHLSTNNIESLPENLCELQQPFIMSLFYCTYYLFLYLYNFLTKGSYNNTILFFFVGKLKFLETLKVDDNGLRALPTSIGGFVISINLYFSVNFIFTCLRHVLFAVKFNLP